MGDCNARIGSDKSKVAGCTTGDEMDPMSKNGERMLECIEDEREY